VGKTEKPSRSRSTTAQKLHGGWLNVKIVLCAFKLVEKLPHVKIAASRTIHSRASLFPPHFVKAKTDPKTGPLFDD
jgi:hypothetical protein